MKSPPAQDLRHASDQQLCSLLGPIADDHDLPLEFFWRLIWQESRFNPNSVSNKGAQGIAQFMPGTALERGLADPFEPVQALKESARLLRGICSTSLATSGWPLPPITAALNEYVIGWAETALYQVRRGPTFAS